MGRPVLNPTVTIGSLIIIGALLVFGGVWPDVAGDVFGDVQKWILNSFGWLYILAVAIFVGVAIFLAVSRFGELKLGPDSSTPEYGFITWVAMLFAAGMGIGLMYFGVSEPMQHYLGPPVAEPGTVNAEREAMVNTFFHWGIHAWAVYGVVGLALGYFGYRYNLPLTVRSGLYPIFKERINGPIGYFVDILALCSTLFGIATALGVGVLQIDSGLNYLFGLPITRIVQIGLIAAVMAAAGVSVVTGIDVGIRRLSELNLSVAIVLMLFVLAVGPTVLLLQSFMQNTSLYLGTLVSRTFTMYAYQPTEWLNKWTLFYWAWWITWSPFVGMFIAKISRGRTVREFILGVLIVPSIITCLWMTVFGNSALFFDRGVANGALGDAVLENESVALFKFFEYLPFTNLLSGLAVLLVTVFFVTSADSGSLVIDTIASGGASDTPAIQRLFWAFLTGAVAAILLFAGGLEGLQTATIAAALPFTVVLLMVCFSMIRAMSADVAGRDLLQQQTRRLRTGQHAAMSWKSRVGAMLRTTTDEDVEVFLRETVKPALDAVADEFRSRDVQAQVVALKDRCWLTIPAGEARDFIYGVQVSDYPVAGVSLRDVSGTRTSNTGYRALTFFADSRSGYDVMWRSREQIIVDVLDQFEVYQNLVESPESNLYITSPETATNLPT